MRSTRTAKHARPSSTRTVLRHAAAVSAATGVLAVPVTASLLAESPLEARADARAGVRTPVAVALPVEDASASSTDARTSSTTLRREAAEAAAAAAAAQAAQVAAEQAAAQVAAQRAADEAAAAARASRSREVADLAVADSSDPRTIAQQLLAARGQADQFSCLNSLWTKESGWSTVADNPTSSAYGIPQALPGSKMASAGPDWRTSARTQITWGLSYIADRYGSPCSAWSHSRSYNWY